MMQLLPSSWLRTACLGTVGTGKRVHWRAVTSAPSLSALEGQHPRLRLLLLRLTAVLHPLAALWLLWLCQALCLSSSSSSPDFESSIGSAASVTCASADA